MMCLLAEKSVHLRANGLGLSRVQKGRLHENDRRQRARALIFCLGFAILLGLCVADDTERTVEQGFSEAGGSHSFLPMTVRFEATK